MKILVVDDDPAYSAWISGVLARAGLQRLGEVSEGHFDLALLDVRMPLMSGWDLLLALRERGRELPVIVVSGEESVAERVRGLRMGADDYVIKPVEPEELLARIEAVVRRRRSLGPLDFGDLRVDPVRRRVERAGHKVDLSPKEYDLLLALVRAGGEVVLRNDLLREVWDMDFDPGTNLLDVHIGRLRRKVDGVGRPLIETVRGEGYRLLRRDR
jgi:DNA-binding response OmpR family regulator